MLLLLVFGFLSGLVTILAPCIWPLLPLVLSASTGPGRTRPMGVTLGLVSSFAFFTLATSTLVGLFHLNPDILRLIAVLALVFLGIVQIFPRLSQVLEGWVSGISGRFGSAAALKGDGLIGGFVTGIFLGLIWSPCAGPILATITALSAIGQVSTTVVLLTLAYVAGVGIPLLLFSYFGQFFFSRLRGVGRWTGVIQQVFGVLTLVIALLIFTGYDKVLQTKLLEQFPTLSGTDSFLGADSKVRQQLGVLQGHSAIPETAADSLLFNTSVPAPEITGGTTWLNSVPLTLAQLRGKVVLIDFWTYTCINCLRTLPHLTDWYAKYKDRGLVIIGVHSPEFEFEKSTANVTAAVARLGVNYPVVQDNGFQIWNTYGNQYWPAEYLVDQNGQVRRTHFGEGEYDSMERAIQLLLDQSGHQADLPVSNFPDETPKMALSPETYLGAKRAQYYAPLGAPPLGTSQFTLAGNTPGNTFDLGGQWTVTPEYLQAGEGAVLEEHFFAGQVFLVLGPGKTTPGQVRVLLDGSPILANLAGADVSGGILTVSSERLYRLVNLRADPGSHLLRLEFASPGVRAFAFTFGQ